MKKAVQITLIVLGCALAFNASASRVDSVWKCKLNDGKEIEGVHKANGEWVKHVNGATDVGEITSATAEAVVGKQEHFFFVDSYPSLAAWAAVQEYVDSDEGKAAMEAIQNQFEDLFDCESNQLYRFTPN